VRLCDRHDLPCILERVKVDGPIDEASPTVTRSVYLGIVSVLGLFAMLWIGDGISAHNEAKLETACKSELLNIQSSPDSWFVSDRQLSFQPGLQKLKRDRMTQRYLGLTPVPKTGQLEFERYGSKKLSRWGRGEFVGCIMSSGSETYLLGLKGHGFSQFLANRLYTMFLGPPIVTGVVAQLFRFSTNRPKVPVPNETGQDHA
jgi:hypothetical protein